MFIDNALKYSEPGTSVKLTIECQQDSVVLKVTDKGGGIPESDLEKVFEPFYRTDAARRGGKKGVGLGLSVARRIAFALGGELYAESIPGRATSFILRLPRAKSAVQPKKVMANTN